MKTIKRFLLTLFAAIMLTASFGMTNVFAEEKGKVKVYVFEAGGCPYCEMELEYLKGLDSYNKKFEIVQKELYIDHEDWEQGKDYELGVKVVELFNKAGFKDAAYTGTPLVIISDKYAAAAYSQDLETYINEAYEEGDKDVVSCVAEGKENCLDIPEVKEDDGVVTAVIVLLVVAGAIVWVVYTRKNINKKDVYELDERNDREEELEKEVEEVVEEKVEAAKEEVKVENNHKKSKNNNKKSSKKK